MNQVMGTQFDRFEHQPALADRVTANVAVPRVK